MSESITITREGKMFKVERGELLDSALNDEEAMGEVVRFLHGQPTRYLRTRLEHDAWLKRYGREQESK